MTEAGVSEPSRLRRGAALVVLVWLAMFLIRALGPSDFLDNDQERPAAYVMDVVVHGRWICQVDTDGDIMSKPPFYTWLGALSVLAWGKPTLVALLLPSSLALLGMSLLVFVIGASRFGQGAGLWAASTLLVSMTGFKAIWLDRTDTLFAALVFATAAAAWSAATGARSWWWFWILAALATLTKGPVGLVIGSLGLVARPWRATGTPRPGWRTSVLGFCLFLAITGGWLVLAWLDRGQPVLDKLLGRELVGHVLSDDKGHGPLQRVWKPALYFVSRFAPWSLFAMVGLWRAFRRPAADPVARGLERYLASYFLAGLAVFSVATHQRPDLLFPLLPAAAILGGREADRLLGPRSRRALAWTLAIGLVAAAVYCFVVFGGQEPVALSEDVRTFAARVEQRWPASHPMAFVETPMGLQFHLGRHQSTLTVKDVAAHRPAAGTLLVAPAASMAALRATIPGLPADDLVAWPAISDPARWEAAVLGEAKPK